MKKFIENPIWNKPAIYLKVYIYLKETNISDFDKIMNAVNEYDSLSKKQLKEILSFINDLEKGTAAVAIIPKKKKKKYITLDDVSADDPEILKLLQDFVIHRKKQEKPLTQYAYDLLRGKLLKLCGDDTDKAKIMLKQSMCENWSGVFPLKNEYLKEYESLKLEKELKEEPEGVEITDADRERALRLLGK